MTGMLNNYHCIYLNMINGKFAEASKAASFTQSQDVTYPLETICPNESGASVKRLKLDKPIEHLSELVNTFEDTDKTMLKKETSCNKVSKLEENEAKVKVELVSGTFHKINCRSNTIQADSFTGSNVSQIPTRICAIENMFEDKEVGRHSVICKSANSTIENEPFTIHNDEFEKETRQKRKSDEIVLDNLPKTKKLRSEVIVTDAFRSYYAVKNILESIRDIGKKIAVTIETLLGIIEDNCLLASNLQQSLEELQCLSAGDEGHVEISESEKASKIIYEGIVIQGNSFLQMLNDQIEVNQVGIAIFESFQQEVNESKDIIKNLPSTSKLIYSSNDIQDVTIKVMKLQKRVNIAIIDHKCKDEGCLGETLDEFLRLCKRSSDIVNSTK